MADTFVERRAKYSVRSQWWRTKKKKITQIRRCTTDRIMDDQLELLQGIRDGERCCYKEDGKDTERRNGSDDRRARGVK